MHVENFDSGEKTACYVHPMHKPIFKHLYVLVLCTFYCLNVCQLVKKNYLDVFLEEMRMNECPEVRNAQLSVA